MATSRKKSRQFEEANRKLKGIESHQGFLRDETLLHFAWSEDHRPTLNELTNEKLRTFREAYRTFDQHSERYFRRNEMKRYAKALQEWTETCVKYLGYETFQESTIEIQTDQIIHCLLPTEDTHTVAVFLSMGVHSPLRIFDKGRLTDKRGETHYEAHRPENLSEQIERALKQSGKTEAVVLMPHNAYYFRADSTTAEQCLEIQWHEMMDGDYDDALALATMLLRSRFFCFATTIEKQTEDEGQGVDGDEEGPEDGSTASIKLTNSSLLFKEDLEQARKITEELHQQVVLALEFLINERLSVDDNLAKRANWKKDAEQVAYDLFKDGLFVLYRILFILYAEARGFLPLENPMFASFYSLEHLRDWSERYLRKLKRGDASATSTYLWGSLNSIFTLLRRGVTLQGSEIVSPYNGQLFAPDRAPLFDQGPVLRDEAIANVLTSLTRIGGDESSRRLHFGNLGVEQLGAVYEALLSQKPIIVSEKSLWVPAHGGGVGLVSETLADVLEMERFEEQEPGGRLSRRSSKKRSKLKGCLDTYIDPRRPGFQPTIGTFIVAPLGGAKRQTASYYTPPKLADFLVRRTLNPLAENKTAKEILNLRCIEPAMGSGGFLVAMVRYLADELLKAKLRDKKNFPELHLNENEKVPQVHLQRCKREIIENCIFGVDINPLAIELARTSLYLEAMVKGEPLPFLHHRLKSGNSLIGADLQGRALSTWGKNGPEFPMLFELPIQYIKVKKEVWLHWDDAYGDKKPSDALKDDYSKRIRELKHERKKIPSETWGTWAINSQTKVNILIQLARKSLEEFEQSQSKGTIIESLDERHRDHIAHIPDMDSVLIEASEVEVDKALLRQRRKALLTELGVTKYNLMVKRQRSYQRLKALGDLSVSLWYWPLDQYRYFPDHSTFRELVDWLLDEKTLERGKRGKLLSKAALHALKIALRVARRLNAFHWDVEYAQVFADMERGGFSALVSNPPWKVVGIQDKEVYPHFDPQFMDTNPAKKKKRIEKLYQHLPEAARGWFAESFQTSQMTEHWRNGSLSEISPEGQVDLSAIFTLRSERIVKGKGRTGHIVSRSSLFVNKATKNIRERLYEDGGLKKPAHL